MNFQSTQINYKQKYPYVLAGEKNLFPLSSTNMNHNEVLYPAVCQQSDLNNQYKLHKVAGLPELQCPNATGKTEIYSEISSATCTMANDNKWWYTNPAQLNFSHQQQTEQERCIPQFKNSIEVCTPRECVLDGNPRSEYLQGYECNKMWNNNTKRRFINGRK
jgi:hypothetical protein